MPSLDKATLGTSIGSALATAHGQGQTSQDTALGNAIADAIDIYIKGSLDSATAGGDPVTPGKTVVA